MTFDTRWLLALDFGGTKLSAALFASQAQAIQPLSLSGFFNLDRLAQQSKSAAFSSWCMTLASRLLPDAFWGSALSPYLVILVRKKHAA